MRTASFGRALLAALLLLMVANLSPLLPAEGAVFRVKPGGTGDGSSWERALGEQEFIAKLADAAAGSEFWVVAGTYRPAVVSEDVGGAGRRVLNAAAQREASFVVRNGVSLYGGFAGNETSREQRKWENNITVLSGKIDEDEQETINSYNVLVLSGDVTGATVVDGFTITGGIADGEDMRGEGGGMHIAGGSPSIANCIFVGNSAKRGGGLFVDGGRPTVRDTVFSHNDAETGGGLFIYSSGLQLEDGIFSGNRALHGGGLFNLGERSGGSGIAQQATPSISQCTFSENIAIEAGGAIFNQYSDPSINDSAFSMNRSLIRGGGIFNHTSTPHLGNSTFSENSAENGGGIFNYESSPVIVNCTFSGNRVAAQGGAIFNDAGSPIIVNATFTANRAATGGGIFNRDSSPVIANTILWGNGTEVRMEGGTTTITYSIVEGGFNGEGNLDLSPRLAALAYNGGTTDTCALLEDSPAINAGLPVRTRISGIVLVPPVDQRGISRPQGSGVDIGAYEYTGPDNPQPTPNPGGSGSSGCSAASANLGTLLLLLPLLLPVLRTKK